MGLGNKKGAARFDRVWGQGGRRRWGERDDRSKGRIYIYISMSLIFVWFLIFFLTIYLVID